MGNTKRIEAGSKVTVWTGESGTVQWWTEDGWFGVKLDGEDRVDEWQAEQVTAG